MYLLNLESKFWVMLENNFFVKEVYFNSEKCVYKK